MKDRSCRPDPWLPDGLSGNGWAGTAVDETRMANRISRPAIPTIPKHRLFELDSLLFSSISSFDRVEERFSVYVIVLCPRFTSFAWCARLPITSHLLSLHHGLNRLT